MKIVMIYDQIQSGAGIKDDHMVPLGAKKEVLGPAVMMQPYLKEIDGKVIACLYCGDGYYKENRDEVLRKICAMVEKIKADVVMCGPAFNYEGYGEMAANVAFEIATKTKIPVLAAMSKENEVTINEFKEKLHIVETPKKGGVGLNEALEGMCYLAKALVENNDVENIVSKYCFK